MSWMILGRTVGVQEPMRPVETPFQSPCVATPVVQSPEPHAAMQHQPENRNGLLDLATPVPEIADMVNAASEEGDGHNDDQDGTGDTIHGKHSPPPGIEDMCRAYEDLQMMLKPNRKTGPRFDPQTQEKLEQMCQFLWNYVDPDTTAHRGIAGSSWMAASGQTAHALGKGYHLA